MAMLIVPDNKKASIEKFAKHWNLSRDITNYLYKIPDDKIYTIIGNFKATVDTKDVSRLCRRYADSVAYSKAGNAPQQRGSLASSVPRSRADTRECIGTKDPQLSNTGAFQDSLGTWLFAFAGEPS